MRYLQNKMKVAFFFAAIHVYFRSSYYNFRLLSIKLQLISPGIVAHDIQSTLEPTGGVGDHVGVVSDAHGSDAERAKGKAEIAVVEGEERGVHVHFKVATGPHVSLPVALVLNNLPAELVLQLEVALGVCVGTSAIL